MCYECSQPEKGYCYICEEKIVKSERKSDLDKLYECEYPDCFKFFESYDKLKQHKSNVHGIPYDGNLNMNLNNDIETMFMVAKPELSFLSSSVAKKIQSYLNLLSINLASFIASSVFGVIG